MPSVFGKVLTAVHWPADTKPTLYHLYPSPYICDKRPTPRGRPLRLRPPTALLARDSNITPAKFPPQETLQKLGIRAFEHDILSGRSCLGGMAGLFSLISIRLVVVWLAVDEMRAALHNV
ncbi:hypothetical protein EV715DRAFT_297608 [Schizophyllum commune]